MADSAVEQMAAHLGIENKGLIWIARSALEASRGKCKCHADP